MQSFEDNKWLYFGTNKNEESYRSTFPYSKLTTTVLDQSDIVNKQAVFTLVWMANYDDKVDDYASHFHVLSETLAADHLVHVRDVVQSRNVKRMDDYVEGRVNNFKKINLDVLPHICNKPGVDFLACKLQQFYVGLRSAVSFEKARHSAIRDLREIQYVNVQKKLDVLYSEKQHLETITTIQQSANAVINATASQASVIVQQFGNSFEKLAEFFEDDANLQVSSLHSDIKSSHETTNQLLSELSEKLKPMTDSLGKAISVTKAVVGMEIAFLTAKLVALAAELAYLIVQSLNPFKWIFGGGPDFGRMKEIGIEMILIADEIVVKAFQMKDLVAATKSLNKITEKLSNNINNLKKMHESNKEAYDEIRNFMEKDSLTESETNAFINSFIKHYENYDGPMTSSDITDMEAGIYGIIELVVGFLDTTNFGGAVKSVALNHLNTAAGLAPQFFARFYEVFEEIELLHVRQADLARAVVKKQNAGEMLDYAKGLKSSTVNTGAAYVLVYSTLSKTLSDYKLQEAAFQFCKYVTYKHSGVIGNSMMTICQQQYYSPDDINSMRSFKDAGYNYNYLNPKLPTKPTFNEVTKMAYPYIDLVALKAGKEVPFTLPMNDDEWLKEHGWMGEHDHPSEKIATYVNSFQLHLPVVVKDSSRSKKFSLQVVATSGRNQFLTSLPEKTFTTPKFKFFFTTNRQYSDCAESYMDPYHKEIDCDKNSDVCLREDGSIAHDSILPSIFNTWTFKAMFSDDDDTNHEILVPTNLTGSDVLVKSTLKVARIRQVSSSRPMRASSFRPADLSSVRAGQCCDSLFYFDVPTLSCKACPVGSLDSLDGYTCMCPSGTFHNNRGSCISCPSQSTFNGKTCVCAGNTFYDSDSNKCEACPANSKTDGDSCICDGNAFYDFNSSKCVQCPANSETDQFYCDCGGKDLFFDMESHKCLQCPDGTVSTGVACKEEYKYIVQHYAKRTDIYSFLV